jgi:hypothetical protein
MADHDAIADLFAKYAWANDTHDQALLGSLFAEEATFALSIAGETAVGPLTGVAALTGFFGEAWGAQSDQRRHVTTNFRYVGESADASQVVAYLLLMATDAGEVSVRCTGIYDTQVARDGDGWRFASMSIELDSGF